ncbi:MAG: FGGY-family carbohydrate kinase [Spirochaetaceae bacterium]|jgi:sugar (pentulose or hexulose) kinase|nr:FGGY-family carbohydrate kinase [Spirochaetaceae bacterium]
MDTKQSIIEGRTVLGIELGSTRIKAVLIDSGYNVIAAGGHDWENRLEDGIWTYHLDDVWAGLQDSFQKLSEEVKRRYGVPLVKAGGIGISAMMHGYLAFDKTGTLLSPFRTWRNTTTAEAAAVLSETFQFNIPQRWSIAHLYQAILHNESHVKDIAFITTLAGYAHWKLSGCKALGIGDASGMFPVDSNTNAFNAKMLNQFDKLIAGRGFGWKLADILPKTLCAGERAGTLTAEGAALLDTTGGLQSGIPLCPPEGDAGTGMVATNSVAERTCNISAGTSVFAMIVMEKDLSRMYSEIDMVTTPAGKPVAMVHCNNCTSDLDAWVKLFKELAEYAGAEIEKSALYDILYNKYMEADTDCGGLVAYNYYGGEPISGIEEGRPLFVRFPDSSFTLANLMRTLLFSTMATLRLGMDILTKKEQVHIDSILGHGGLFKTKEIGQRMTAAALETPVTVMESAGEGGAWGIALLAAFMLLKESGETLETFLGRKVFAGLKGSTIAPDEEDAQSFKQFMERYTAGLDIEHAAVTHLKRG